MTLPLCHTFAQVPPCAYVRASHVSPDCRSVTPPTSDVEARLAPHSYDFRGPRFQSISLTHFQSSTIITRVSHPRLYTSYPDAPSSGAITGLSYTTIRKACALRYQVLQISPQTPDTSRCPQQPTCRVQVRRSLAAPDWDLHPFNLNRVGTVTCAPLSVSPNPD